MKKRKFVPYFLVMMFLAVLSSHSSLWAASPTAIAQDAVSFDIEASKVFYESRPGCVSIVPDGMDGDESEYNEEISRVPTYGGLDRTLFRKAVGIICGTQIFDLTSNLIADGEYTGFERQRRRTCPAVPGLFLDQAGLSTGQHPGGGLSTPARDSGPTSGSWPTTNWAAG